MLRPMTNATARPGIHTSFAQGETNPDELRAATNELRAVLAKAGWDDKSWKHMHSDSAQIAKRA